MPRKGAPPQPGPPSLDAKTALAVLTKQLEAGENLGQEGRGLAQSAYSSWETEARHWIEQSFGEKSTKVIEFQMAGDSNYPISSDMTEADFSDMRRQALSDQVTKLRAFTNLLRQTCELAEVAPTPGASPGTLDSNKVFVVHGHDDGAKETTARFLARLALEPVILHEQPSRGLTIIEKLMANDDVGFAVVLLTPDDRAGPAAAAHDEQKLRARQNVVLELGYFLGKLGRERVCALYKEGTEIPSDFQGVVFVPMDAAGAWRLTLARELKQVLPHVDLNKAI
jgi:predicted nucleotide-binding protein